MSKTSILTWCIPTWAYNNKLGAIWTQLVFKVARKRKKNKPLLHNFVCFRMHKIKASAEVFLIFWVRNYLFLKTNITSEGTVCQCFIPSTALHCSLPSKFLWQKLFWVISNSVQCLKFTLVLLHVLLKPWRGVRCLHVLTVCNTPVSHCLTIVIRTTLGRQINFI